MYKIVLPIFEGPLDLLLYFIKRDEINIYDIPIAKITDEFLNYLKIMQKLDLEVASEFLVMASTLMEIKAKMLLPAEKKDNPEQIEDPRKELVAQLLEYQIFKEVSSYLEQNLEKMQNFFFREIYESDLTDIASKLKTFRPATVYELAKAFYELIARNEQIKPKEIKIAEYKIEDAITVILETLQSKNQISFNKLCEKASKQIVVLYFIAILELVKQNIIYAYQTDSNSEIFLFLVTKSQNN